MLSFQEWKITDKPEIIISQDNFVKLCLEYCKSTLSPLKTYYEHKDENLLEVAETSRYSIEVNFRTKTDEVLEANAKIVLGYVSSALKKFGFHTKHVFTEKPIRLIVTNRNWDNGSWAGLITWNKENFILSTGFYNADRKTVAIQNSHKCSGDSASELTKDLHNMMHHLKDQPDKHMDKYKPLKLKTGPKK